MAVTVDHVSVDGTPAVGSQLVWSHDTSGSPTGVGVGIAWRDANANITISSVTYGGQAMTAEDEQSINSGILKVAIYSLANPPSGTQAINVSFSASCDRKATGYAVSVVGGSTSDVFGTPVKTSTFNSSISRTVTSDTDELVMDIVAAEAATSGSETVGADQTQRMDYSLDGAAAWGSTEPGAASVVMSWAFIGTVTCGMIAAAFNPSTGTGTEPLLTSASTGGADHPISRADHSTLMSGSSANLNSKHNGR